MKNKELQTAREKAKMTQRAVAQKVNVTERMYQKYEYGVEPGVQVAIKIAEALNIKSFKQFKEIFRKATSGN